MTLYGLTGPSHFSSVFGTNFSTYFPKTAKLPMGDNSPLSSWYGTNTVAPSQTANSAVGIKSAASALRQAVETLSKGLKFGLSNTIYDQSKVTSSDTSKVSASLPNPFGLTNTKDIALSVTQLAAKQENSTAALDKDGTDFAAGVQTFTIKSGGQTKDVTVEVREGDTNATVFGKIAKAIDTSGMGLNSSVVTDAKTGTASLFVESKITGLQNGFTLEDKTGTLIADSGMSVKKAAADAVYTVDGALQTSSSNNISIGRVNATLKETGDVTLSFSSTNDALRTAADDFVSAYNKLYESSPKAAEKLLNISSTYGRSLINAGFAFDDSGKMSVNDAAFDRASKNGALKSLFTEGTNYGFATKLADAARSIEQSPMPFAVKSSIYDMYSNFGKNSYAYQNMALLFNAYI